MSLAPRATGAGIAPSFYAYAYPTPAGYAAASIRPDEAGFDATLGEFLLPYDAVRQSAAPEQTLLRFLQSSYRAAAEAGGWNRAELESELGMPRLPRQI